MSFRSSIRGILQCPILIKNNTVLYLHGIKAHRGCRVLGSVSVVNKGKISIGERCTLDGRQSRIGFCQPITLTTQRNGEILIGNHVGLSNCTLYAMRRIQIGDDTLIGGGVKIYDTDFHSTDWRVRNTPEDKQNTSSAPVVIGKRCFVGAGSIILKGVQIGEGAVIGAGAVVTKDIPPFEIWAGNPAKRICQINT